MAQFDDIVNKEFLEKHEISPEYVDKDGKVKFESIYELYDAIDGAEYPNRFLYTLVHGRLGLMGAWETPPQFRGHEDRIYKMCLDKGVTWKELLAYKEPGEDVLL